MRDCNPVRPRMLAARTRYLMTANIYATESLIKSNTFQLQYDFSKRLTFRIGYEDTNRTIADFSATFYTVETYFPGGAPRRMGKALVESVCDASRN